jgi:hypothetical protein
MRPNALWIPTHLLGTSRLPVGDLVAGFRFATATSAQRLCDGFRKRWNARRRLGCA